MSHWKSVVWCAKRYTGVTSSSYREPSLHVMTWASSSVLPDKSRSKRVGVGQTLRKLNSGCRLASFQLPFQHSFLMSSPLCPQRGHHTETWYHHPEAVLSLLLTQAGLYCVPWQTIVSRIQEWGILCSCFSN